jgi:homoserine kinase type II
MAVFTEVSFDEAAALVRRLDVGELTSLVGIVSGIENTNYFVDTTRGRYVLTLFERLSFEQLPFYLHLMKHLAERGIAVPAPHADAAGKILHTLCGKPAALVDRLRGGHELAPSLDHCAQVGTALARMHLAGLDYPRSQPNLRSLVWWGETVPLVLPFLDADQQRLMESELAFQRELAASPAYAGLPQGAIHADLFRDNVMFEEGRLSGLFDFYFAGVDHFVYDLAICVNDWCVDLPSGRLEEERAAMMVAAYDAVRPLTGDELRLVPGMLRGAAFRFWLSRLWDLHLPRDASMLQPHDPSHFERMLRERVGRPWHYLRG